MDKKFSKKPSTNKNNMHDLLGAVAVAKHNSGLDYRALEYKRAQVEELTLELERNDEKASRVARKRSGC
jgi:hypothetical protein